MSSPRPILTLPNPVVPMDLTTLKERLKIEVGINELDGELQSYLSDATEIVEQEANTIFLTSSWDWNYGQPVGPIRLPFYNVTSVESVAYDGMGLQEGIDWEFRGYLTRPEVAPVAGGSWPTGSEDTYPVLITFTAGFADKSEIPIRMIDSIAAIAKRLFDWDTVSDPDLGQIYRALHRRSVASYML